MAIGTSLPELVVSVTSALNGLSDISIGNVVGSNFANLFLIISLCAAIKPLHMKKQSRFIDQPFVLICTIIFYFIVSNNGIVSRNEGFALLLIAFLYIIYTILAAKYGKNINQYDNEDEEDTKKRTIIGKTKVGKAIKESYGKFEKKFPGLYCAILIVLGIVLLKVGGDITVDNARLVALSLGLSDKLISLTIVALGTSLPELITCMQALKKKETDLAIGNIAGSQVFNILLVLGASSAIRPIYNVSGYLDEIMILIVGNAIFAIAPFVSEKHRVGRFTGISFVLIYFGYMTILVLESLNIIQR